jgi:hypothetical protein
VRCSSCGDRRVPQLRKSSTVRIWQHDKGTDDYKIILNCVRKWMKNKSEKEAGKGPNFFEKCDQTHVHNWYKFLLTQS